MTNKLKTELRDKMAAAVSKVLHKINETPAQRILSTPSAYEVAQAVMDVLPPFPGIVPVYAQFETKDGRIIGTANVPVKRVDVHDDGGGVMVTLDYWPDHQPILTEMKYLRAPDPKLAEKRMSELTPEQQEEVTELWLWNNRNSFRHDTHRHINLLLDRLAGARGEALQRIAAAAAAPDPDMEQLLLALSDSGCVVTRSDEGDYVVTNKRAEALNKITEEANAMIDKVRNDRNALQQMNDTQAETISGLMRTKSDLEHRNADLCEALTNKQSSLEATIIERNGYRDDLVAERQKPLPPGFTFDNPENDGTDNAHPAWWRAYDQGCGIMCSKIEDILTGKDTGQGVSNPPWEGVRRKLIEMVEKHDAKHDRVTELEQELAGLKGAPTPSADIQIGMASTCVLGQDIDMIGVWEAFKTANPRTANPFDAMVFGVNWARKQAVEVPLLNRRPSDQLKKAWEKFIETNDVPDTYFDRVHDAVKFGIDWALKNTVYPAIGTDEDWAIRHTEAGITGWVHDRSSLLPSLFSKDNAERLCINENYKPRRVLLVAYDVTEEPKS